MSCNHEGYSLKTVIHNNKLIEGCDKCLPTLVQGYSAKFDREWQKKQYRKELVQPNQAEYARAYPEDFRKRYGDEMYRKYG